MLAQAKKGLAFGNNEVVGIRWGGEAFGQEQPEQQAMRFSPEIIENRREFLRAGLRYSFTALLTAATGLAARNRPIGRHCTNRSLCSNCDKLTTCGLPQALSARAAAKSVQNE